MSTALPRGVTRTKIPFLLPDMVTITDPALIRKAATSPDITRPADAELPILLRFFFRATKFLYLSHDAWATPMLADDQEDRPARRAAAEALLAAGFTPEQKRKFVDLVLSGAPLQDVQESLIRVFGDVLRLTPPSGALPPDVVTAARSTAVNVDGLGPQQYLAARAARRRLEEYMEQTLPRGAQAPGDVADYVHNLCATNGFAVALESLRGAQAPDARAHFRANPVVSSVLRVSKRETTLGGVLPDDAPLRPGSVLLLAVGGACTETGDDNFFFGVGVPERQCPFKRLFFETVDDMYEEVKGKAQE